MKNQVLHRVVLLLALATLFATLSCGNHPSQADPARYGTVRVWYGEQSDWTSQQVEQLDLQLTAMAVLGPAFVRVQTFAESDVSVRHWDSLSSTCSNGVERYTASTRVIEIDPVCTHGFSEFRGGFGHGLEHHVMSSTHVCHHQGELPNCSPVGFGVAVLNPQISYGDTEIGFDHAYTGPIGTFDPTALDLAEYRRLHP